ncbi:hypothetical protein L228DRAFT_279233 [Xylona heveae TC161]|uniref:Uncharacterized protein n=1 Tax=Xylona heveae (strain CBS 132557 / TC161) TaxID=1328760 RepID=A0A165JAI1_XYLHT|nr:hypothetical protein L228DRAFT_279233 [Xylona heveae TC161]KZF25972.1 hypothetical protein L228DRAFT_279233 [Xylona heveae TC161]
MSVRGESSSEPVKGGAGDVFEYGSGGFVCQGHYREEPKKLKVLLFPETARGKQAVKEAAEEANHKIKKSWLIAQLKHYGLPARSSATVGELKEQLQNSLKQGLCTSVPASMLSLEAELRNLFNRKNTAQGGGPAGQRNPKSTAQQDPNLFISEYYLGISGKPNRSKSRKPIVLVGLNSNERAAILAAAERVPGLETNSAGNDPHRVLAIGWDRNAVWDEASKAASQANSQPKADNEKKSRQKQTPQASKTKAEAPKKSTSHKTDADSKSKAASKDDSQPKRQTGRRSQPFSMPAPRVKVEENEDNVESGFIPIEPLSNGKDKDNWKRAVRGYYSIECDDITEQWDVEDMNLSIVPHQKEGCFQGDMDFGVLEGTMLFAFTEEQLMQVREEEEYGKNGGYDDEPVAGKRKAQTAATAVSKKAKTTSNTRRLYLQWRGRETGEGEIQLDYDNDNVGYLDFTDDTCATFHGQIDISFVKSCVKFSGFRRRNTPQTNSSWMDYSEEAYSYASRRRWGGW